MPLSKFFETLECRTLMHLPAVAGVIADNRGEATITLNAAVDPSTVSKTSVYMYLHGPDRKLGTADDARVPASVRLSGNRITVRGSIPAGTSYRVRLIASRIKATDGHNLDGEFKGRFPSGNGVAGGDFNFLAVNDKSDTPLARISTTMGAIAIRLRKDAAPQTVINFIRYINTGRYDGTIIHRNSRVEQNSMISVLQGGAFTSLDLANSAIDTLPPIPLEAGLPNIRGSIAMARASDDQGTATATSSFFLNVTDNPELNPNNGIPGWSPFGYAVFGQVVSGLSTLDAIDQLPTTPVSGSFFQAPVQNGQPVAIRRAAIQMRISRMG
ncbi:peptidylprolyl isomerase [Fontivita pretiosa]|uniref:peptidylprolyl isomerase n=1 Tax=Fontivita pretiosa TaxID=2989684 RepID=UPI003D171054